MYIVLYKMRIQQGKEKDFLDSWQDFNRELRTRYPNYGSRVHVAENGDYYIYAQWPSRRDWEAFWITKEQNIESITALKACLKEPARTKGLRVVYSTFDSHFNPNFEPMQPSFTDPEHVPHDIEADTWREAEDADTTALLNRADFDTNTPTPRRKKLR